MVSTSRAGIVVEALTDGFARQQVDGGKSDWVERFTSRRWSYWLVVRDYRQQGQGHRWT